jgi:predicted O-methyltransferase YrrM
MTAGITQLNYYSESPPILNLILLEIGTSLGLATAALALGSKSIGKNAKIVTLEGCPETSSIAKFNCKNSI